MYRIQAEKSKGQWVTLFHTVDQAEAMRKAKLLSVENNTPHRVVSIDDDIETFIIAYDWGREYVETEGVQTFIPTYYNSLIEQEANPAPLIFYVVQSRPNPVHNELRYGAWQTHNTRRYVEYEDAAESAKALSIEHPELDFRVVYADINIIPSIVFRGGVQYAQLGDAPIAPPEKQGD